MKNKNLILFICIAYSVQGKAQNNPLYKPFDMELGFGVAIQQLGKPGAIFNINPAYTIANKFKTGIQFEGVVYDMRTTGSAMLTLDYYFFSKSHFRFYGGGGFGFASTSFSGGCSIPQYSQTQTTGKTGETIRLGFDWQHLNLRVAYNFSPSTYITSTLDGAVPVTTVYKTGYLGITLGIRIGGYKKSQVAKNR